MSTSSGDALPPTEASGDDATLAKGRALVALLVADKHADAVATFNATMAAALPADRLETTWNELVAQVGAFETIEAAHVVHQGRYATAVLTCKFASGRLDAKVSYDEKGEVAGLHFAPVSAPYGDASYVDRTKFDEREVSIGSGEWVLPGTLALPKGTGPFRAVVLVHGSGPNDRDETVGANKPFKDLAGGLVVSL